MWLEGQWGPSQLLSGLSLTPDKTGCSHMISSPSFRLGLKNAVQAKHGSAHL